MRRILVASDTHGREEGLKKILKDNAPLDVFIFCGDGDGLEDRIFDMLDIRCRVHMVRGNNDYMSRLNRDEVFQLGRHRCFLTHGHRHLVGHGMQYLAEAASAQSCSIAFFGHTHVPHMETEGGVLCINPGSLSLPRQEGRRGTYLLITESEEGELSFLPKEI